MLHKKNSRPRQDSPTRRIRPTHRSSMRRARFFSYATLAFAFALLATPAFAAPILLDSNPDHCRADELKALSEAPRGALSTDEQRVVLWLVHQILSAESDDATMLEFRAAEISSTLGLDVQNLDRERIQEHVRATLVEISCQRARDMGSHH